jgi:hypothetical protein
VGANQLRAGKDMLKTWIPDWVASGNFYESTHGLCILELIPTSEELVNAIEQRSLVNQSLCVTCNIHEQDLERSPAEFFLTSADMPRKSPENKAIQYFRFPRTVETNARIAEHPFGLPENPLPKGHTSINKSTWLLHADRIATKEGVFGRGKNNTDSQLICLHRKRRAL